MNSHKIRRTPPCRASNKMLSQPSLLIRAEPASSHGHSYNTFPCYLGQPQWSYYHWLQDGDTLKVVRAEMNSDQIARNPASDQYPPSYLVHAGAERKIAQQYNIVAANLYDSTGGKLVLVKDKTGADTSAVRVVFLNDVYTHRDSVVKTHPLSVFKRK